MSGLWGKPTSLESSILEPAQIDEHVARLGALERTHHAELLELIHQPSGARVADLEAALQQRRRALLVVDHELGRFADQLVVERIDFAVAVGALFPFRRQSDF